MIQEILNQEHKSLIVNAFGGPGAGKTTSCYEITAELKKLGYSAEYVSEYAKELVYDKNWNMLDGSLKHQGEILIEQISRLERIKGQVDFIVTDAPIIMNLTYCNQDELTAIYQDAVALKFKEYDNYNFLFKMKYKKESVI